MINTHTQYTLTNFIPNFFVTLFLFSFLLFSINIIPIIEVLLLHRAPFGSAISIIIYTVPEVINFVMPATFLTSSLLTFFQFVESNEHIALFSLGMSEWEITRPLLMLGIMLVIPYFLLANFIAPVSNRNLNKALYSLAQFHPSAVLKPMVFMEPFSNVTVYVTNISQEQGQLLDVLVMDKRDPNTALVITSKKARAMTDKQNRSTILEFKNGRATVIPRKGVPKNVSFESYILMIEEESLLSGGDGRQPKPKEMTIEELLRQKDVMYNDKSRMSDIKFALYYRFIAPIAGILMVIIGGITPIKIHFHQKYTAIVTGIIIFLGYYTLYTGMKSLAKSGQVAPQLCAFVPIIFLLMLFFIASNLTKFLYLSSRLSKYRAKNSDSV